MILFLYNIIQVVLLIFLLPLILLIVCLRPKYRGRCWRRLGFGLAALKNANADGQRIWIHALSVGEVASSIPLVEAIRVAYPKAVIYFSATTKGGEQLAGRLSESVDEFVPFPFDIYWVVNQFIRVIRPDCFLLVETDFWPNFLFQLKKGEIPAILVNGRMTETSFRRYLTFAGLFRPLFAAFSFLVMQTEKDVSNMVQLGAPREKVAAFGNLKLVPNQQKVQEEVVARLEEELPFSANRFALVAGSTHAGEEEHILACFSRLKKIQPEALLILAPRDPGRANDLISLVQRHHFSGTLRSALNGNAPDVVVLDTLGELSGCYAFADLAFVGGSLVPEGGHNPLEPAWYKKPVLFGPHMEDFSEISQGLLAAGGAQQIHSEKELISACLALAENKEQRETMGAKAFAFIQSCRGNLDKYLQLIRRMMPVSPEGTKNAGQP